MSMSHQHHPDQWACHINTTLINKISHHHHPDQWVCHINTTLINEHVTSTPPWSMNLSHQYHPDVHTWPLATFCLHVPLINYFVVLTINQFTTFVMTYFFRQSLVIHPNVKAILTITFSLPCSNLPSTENLHMVIIKGILIKPHFFSWCFASTETIRLIWNGERGGSGGDEQLVEVLWPAKTEEVITPSEPNSKPWFTTSFLGERCRKAMLGVCVRNCVLC